MTKEEFARLSQNKVLFMDGATGSNLVKSGMPSGVCPEKWILEHPDVLVDLQKTYIENGSQFILSPTFTANRIKLSEYGLQNDIENINKELVALSKKAAGDKAFVVGDITMTGRQLSPVGDMEFEELVDVYKEQVKYLCEAGVDLITVETMMSLQETRCAVIACKEVCDLPIICTMTFESDGRTLYGQDPQTCALVLDKLGVSAIGANCSSGPDKMAQIIKEMALVTDLPLIAKPNAGMPTLDKDGKTVYDMSPADFKEAFGALMDNGASMIGGCCGTDPSYIKAIHDEFKDYPVKVRTQACQKRFLSSERKVLPLYPDGRFLVVGERINPTGKKKLQEELKEGKLDLVLQYTEEQENCGAQILDINVGMGLIDENEMMQKVLREVTVATSLPLSIDTTKTDVLENALRFYPGRALVNSVSAESKTMEDKLKIARKYGAMIIVLPLSDKGLPENMDEKIENINTVLDKAFAMGFTKEDIVIDGLVGTVGANKKACLEVLETIKYSKDNNFLSTCGLSNISFGLPERSFVNTAFLTMAISAGLSMAIMNPSQEMLMNASFASDLLMAKDGADIAYIDRMNEHSFVLESKNKQSANDVSVQNNSASENVLYKDVLKGNKEGVVEHTENELKLRTADDILNNTLMPAIDEVGKYFNDGKYFLPQLIASAETMKSSIAVLEKTMEKKENQKDTPTIVLATVKGDIHDIGKNLVAMMLSNHGFKVIDLGKDVAREEIVDAAIKENAAIIGLSALMTTTMDEMKRVIKYAKDKGCKSKIMVGGAVITEDYAKEIGADGYSKDAAESVLVAKKLLG